MISTKYTYRLIHDKKFRKNSKYFVVEGTRWMDELVSQQVTPQVAYATADWMEKASEDLRQNIELQVIKEREMQKLSDTSTPSGVLAVVKKPSWQWSTNFSLILILDGLRDPGNVGTLIRSARAAGVDAIVTAPQTTDIFNPKVVRSSMGSLLRIPILELSWEEIRENITSHQIVGADMQGENYTQVNWQQPTALVIGNEAHGLSKEVNDLVSNTVAIPMADETESLNAAIAGSVMLFEAKRQRSSGE